MSLPRAPLTPDQQSLVENAMDLARRLAAHFKGRGSRQRLSDIMADASVGLVQAAQAYDPGHEAGADFETFAYGRVFGAIRNGESVARRGMPRALAPDERSAAKLLATEDVEPDAEPGEATDGARMTMFCDRVTASMFFGLVGDASKRAGEGPSAYTPPGEAAKELVHEALADMSEADGAVLTQHHLEDRELQDIAPALGISYSSTRRLHNDAFGRLSARVLRLRKRAG